MSVIATGPRGSSLRRRTSVDARRAIAVRSALEAEARAALVAGDADRAMQVALAAADIAHMHHSGEYVSESLDQLVRDLAISAGEWPDAERVVKRAPSRITHVMTEAYTTGGHTRLVWRWMRLHTRCRHDLVLVDQREEVPPPLRTAVHEAGGTLTRLDGRPLERVLDLRRRLVDSDLVVLHIHPHDVVSLAAVAHPHRTTPTALFNHADHVFWAGSSLVDRVINFRESGRELTIARRGVHPSRAVVVPLPLEAVVVPTGEAVRRRLVTVGDAYKYAQFDGLGLPDLVSACLDRDASVEMVVIGVDPGNSSWQRAVDRHPDRIKLVGRVLDPGPIIDSAAVFLDSYAIAGGTSWLDAGARGVPVVAYRPPQFQDSVMSGDLHADVAVVKARNVHEWLEAVALLLDDPVARQVAGEQLRGAIMDLHVNGWGDKISAATAGVSVDATLGRPLEPVSRELEPHDDVTIAVRRDTGQSRPFKSFLEAWGVADLAPRVVPGAGPADVSIILAVRGSAQDVVRAFNNTLPALAVLGHLDIQCIDRGVDDSGFDALTRLDGDVRLVVPDEDQPMGGLPLAMATAAAATVVYVTSDVVLTQEAVVTCLRALSSAGTGTGIVPVILGAGGTRVSGVDLSAPTGVCLFLGPAVTSTGRLDAVLVADEAVCRTVSS